MCFFIYFIFPSFFKTQQFILMTSSKQSYKYGTPERQTNTEIKQFSYSTAAKRTDNKVSPNGYSEQYLHPQKYFPGLNIEQLKSEKLAWYQMKVDELRTYVDNNHQIDKRVLKRIFDWSDSIPEESREINFLRELNIKVKNLIHENQELRQNLHSKDLQKLRHENMRLQKMIMEFQRGQSVRQTSLDDENRYLRNYINQKTNNKAQFKEYQSGLNYQKQAQQVSLIDHNGRKTNLIDNKLQMIIESKSISEQNLNNMKRFFTNYINAVTQQNDSKLEAQSRYIDSLQKRLKYIEEQVNIKFNHLKFEKKVQLQNSVRKSKNFSVEMPSIKGEQDILQDIDQENINNAWKSALDKRDLLVDLSRQSQQGKRERQNLQTLKRRIRQLEEDYQYLEEKYAIQIQNHIRDTASREEALIKVQKLQTENKILAQKARQISKELKDSQKYISQIQHGSVQKKENSNLSKISNASNEIVEQLKQIREEIQSCSMNYSKEAEKLINKLVIEKDSLKRQLIQTQKIVLEQSKNSTLQKQIFLLKSQNTQLQNNCRFYQKQIQEYSAQLNQLQQQKKSRLLNGYQQQSAEINEKEKIRAVELSGVQWQRMAHECMVNSVHRLIHLENQLKKQGNLKA